MRIFSLLPATLATVVAILPGVAQATSTTCTTSAVCAEYINTYAYSNGMTTGGVAIHGEADSGIGVRGTSVGNVGFYGASGSGNGMFPGVEGESTNNTGSDTAGGFGLAAIFNSQTAPYYGIAAFGRQDGLYAATTSAGKSSASGLGVIGVDSVYSGSSSGDYNAGVSGQTTFGTGVLAEANGAPAAGIYSTAPVGMYSVAKKANGTPASESYAFVGESDSVGLELRNTSAGEALFGATQLFFLTGSSTGNGGGSFSITYSGNESLSGTLTTSKGTYVRTTGASGAAMREYGPRSTVPNVEDFGEAQLSNGRAFVPIDARFGDAIDNRSSYLVFVTPEGDCKGLFVTQKAPAGFVVRELQGGHSSLSFEYRIVAKPIDESGTRLAAMPAEALPEDVAEARKLKAETVPAPLSFEEHLKRRLGLKGYQKALEALSARLDAKH